MLSFTSLVTALLVSSVAAAPSTNINNDTVGPHRQLASRQGQTTYSFWTEGAGTFNCNNQNNVKYTCNWSGGSGGGMVAGVGFKPGGNRAVKYSGTYTPKGPGYLSLYGWTQNPLVEYYIVESYDVLAPGEPWTFKGNFSAGDEGSYSIYTSQRVNKPSIEGTRTFTQYWSVRNTRRVGGTITTGKHFDAWSKLGMKLGTQSYMILATEGFANGTHYPSGSSSISVS